jgi:hypothetical protein
MNDQTAMLYIVHNSVLMLAANALQGVLPVHAA